MVPEDDLSKREAVIAYCLALNSSGLNQGTSGNISIRHEDGMLISPTSRPYASLTAEDIVFVDGAGAAHGAYAPSSEWRFHKDILDGRPDVNAVVHAHPPRCTAVAIMGKEIPPIHYMLAVFGGPSIRCAPYEIYGSEALSKAVVTALEGRKACLMAHHGMIAIGSTIEQAFWLAGELEALSRQYLDCLSIGEPPLLSAQQIQDVINKINGYGMSNHKPEQAGAA